MTSESVDPGQFPRYDAVIAILTEHRARLDQLITQAAAKGEETTRFVLERTRETLASLDSPEKWGPGGPVSALMKVGRRFYDEVRAALPADVREQLQLEAQAALEGSGTDMSAEARSETLGALEVTFLRERYLLFDPGRLLALWDE